MPLPNDPPVSPLNGSTKQEAVLSSATHAQDPVSPATFVWATFVRGGDLNPLNRHTTRLCRPGTPNSKGSRPHILFARTRSQPLSPASAPGARPA